MQIIGISGKAGAGKDWLAGVLGRAAGYKRWSFALPMKAAGFGTGFTREEVDVTKPPHVRAWLQHYGTEEHRDRYRLDFWLRCADYFLDHLEAQGMADRIVIPDVRFPNEVDWVHARGGKVVVVDHGMGYSTRYGHNRQILVKTGDRVKRGQIVATMGETGNATGPHCHYEVWYNGRAVNPGKFLKKHTS